MTVFGKPNFGDPTLFEKKHEVLGYYVQKWKTGDYGMFQPEYAILPQVRTTFITGNIGKGLEKLLRGFLVFTTYKGIIHDPWWNDMLGRMVRV